MNVHCCLFTQSRLALHLSSISPACPRRCPRVSRTDPASSVPACPRYCPRVSGTRQLCQQRATVGRAWGLSVRFTTCRKRPLRLCVCVCVCVCLCVCSESVMASDVTGGQPQTDGRRDTETGNGRREMGDGIRRREMGDGRWETGDGRREMGDGRIHIIT